MSFGMGTKSTMQSMIVDGPQNSQLTHKEYKAPIDTLTKISGSPDDLLDALKKCFVSESFKSQFFNVENEQFEPVQCTSFADLLKRSEMEAKDLGCAVEMIQLLTGQMQRIKDNHSRNSLLLKEVAQRLQILNLIHGTGIKDLAKDLGEIEVF